jgi:transcriptional regulator
LLGHISRANPQWRETAPEIEALAIFTGPDAYISPGWYPSKQETGKVVPTWNYVAVHAYGTIEFFDEADALRDVVNRLTNRQEAGRDEPWAVTDAPDDFVQAMLKGIVGFRLPIARLEGKWKMSQNRNAADRDGAIAGLKAEKDLGASAVAALVPKGS